MNTSHLLTIHPRSLPPEGLDLRGEIPPRELDLPEDDRMSFANPIALRLHVGPVSGGVLATGTLRTTLRCRCDRCLTYYSESLDVSDCVHFYKPADNDAIDLTDDLRQDILLNFPQQTLCRDNCRGLCSNCGRNLNVRDCGCRPRATSDDNVWQTLDRLQLPGSDE